MYSVVSNVEPFVSRVTLERAVITISNTTSRPPVDPHPPWKSSTAGVVSPE